MESKIKYAKAFCDKQELVYQGLTGWKKDIVIASDYHINIMDVITDINTNQPKGNIIDWMEVILSNHKYISYQDYLELNKQ
jgi:hypothetical protein